MKDNHSETEVKSQAAEESELVSRQRNVGGVRGGVQGIGVSIKRQRSWNQGRCLRDDVSVKKIYIKEDQEI